MSADFSDPTLLIVIDSDAARDRKAAEVERVLAHWPANVRPTPRLYRADAVAREPGVLGKAGLVWLMMDHPHDDTLYELAGQATERHLPVVLTRPDETRAAGDEFDIGVTICPPATPDATACAMLRALWNQSMTLDELFSDMRLLRAHQGELSGQIRRMDEELRLAAQLQREFLPASLPQADDFVFRVFFRPAGYVSGDIYDLARLDEHHVGLFLADAVGHGVPAALMTMYIKRSLHTKVIDPALPAGYRLMEPAETLAKLNADLIKHQGDQVRFATAAYAVINCQTHKVCLARAGHPAPILLRANGKTESYEPDGSLLGVFPEETFEQQCFQLNPGDRFLLYSDGFEMAFPGATRTNGERKVASDQYCQEFEDFRNGDLDSAIARLEAKLDGQLGSLNQRDDLTMVCVSTSTHPAEVASPSEQQQDRPHERRRRPRTPAPSPVG